MRSLAIASLGLLLSSSVASLSFAAETTVTGHLRDSFCYVILGAQGPSHQKCAIACAKKGVPVALVQSGTDKTFILLPPKNARPLPDSVINKMENEVTVTGDEYTKGGVTYLTVKSVK